MLLLNVPENYFPLIGKLPERAQHVSEKKSSADFIHLFVKKNSELKKNLPQIVKRLEQNGMIWVSWYKKSSGIATDITEDVIREIVLPTGWVDIKVCAVSDVWSALKIVKRKKKKLSAS